MVSIKPIKTLSKKLLIISISNFLLLSGLLFFVSLSFSINSQAQIKIYERPPLVDRENAGLSFQSNTRTKIDLNGEWQASFNDGESFNPVSVPIAYEYKGKSIFKKGFSIPQNLIGSHSFILVAEGINYESSIRLNKVFLINHKQGFTAIIIPIEDEIIHDWNEIEVSITNKLTTGSTIPLADQLNYSRIYGGINKDIYIIAVPKISTLSNSISYNIEGYNKAVFENNVTIKSSSLDIYPEKSFTLTSQVIDKSTGQIVADAAPVSFTIEEFKSINVKSNFSFDSPKLWSFESPNLYVIKTIISDSSGIIDERLTEVGIRKVHIKNNTIFVNGKEYNLKGINYYEDSPIYASALDYYEVERDLKNIKDLGINCIRVPGRTPHPYIVNLCNQLGLFLFAEIPFNEVPHALLKEEDYIKESLDYLSSAISQYKNNPSVLAWGIGNDFDVTKPASAEYVKLAKERSLILDNRPVYYTTKNFDRDVCTEYADFKGINLLGSKMESIKDFTTSLEKNLNLIKKSTGKPIFISDYGLSIENENRNGAQNIHSIEAQAEFIVETYKAISNKFFVNIISSYADWNAERPFNYPQNYNKYLQTNGVFTIYREPKQAALYIKRLINNQDTPQILEGNPEEDNSQLFLIAGVILCIGLVFLVFNVRKFQDYAVRSILRPTNFFQFAGEQMLIPVTLNFFLAILISLGLGLYFSSISYFYRENIQFDMFLANIFASDWMKIFFSDLSNEPLYSILILSLVAFIFQILVSFIIFAFSFFISGRSYYKNIFTVTVWSALQMVIFLPIGTFIFKLAQEDTEYVYISLILFLLLLVFYIIRLIKGARTVYNLSFVKAYGFGMLLFLLTFGSLYSYFYFFRHTQYVISLLNSYLKG
jgi:beta-glucuronidase